MGREIKRDMCPEKYYTNGSLVKDTLPTLIAVIIVAFFSGSMFNEAGIDLAVTALIEAAVVLLMYAFVFFMFKGMKKRLSETYISVCENGACGICPINGFKNKTFECRYDELTKLIVKGERLFLYSKKGNVFLTLRDAPGTAELIKSKNENL